MADLMGDWVCYSEKPNIVASNSNPGTTRGGKMTKGESAFDESPPMIPTIAGG